MTMLIPPIPSILQDMSDAIPTHEKGDESSDVASSYEVIALLVHAYLVSMGFRLCSFSEAKSNPACQRLAPRLPPEWNARFGQFTFVYTHRQSSMTFVFRIDRMGPRVQVRGLAQGHDQILHMDWAVRDVVDAGKLPIRITMTEDGEEDRRDLVSLLTDVFDEVDMRDFVLNVHIKIVEKLMSGASGDADDDVEFDTTGVPDHPDDRRQRVTPHPPGHSPQPNVVIPQVMPQSQAPAPRRTPLPNPLLASSVPGTVPGLVPQADFPQADFSQADFSQADFSQADFPQADFPPPRFEDEHRLNQPPAAGGGLVPPPQHPYGIGHDDLNPPGLGPRDPFRGAFVGGGGGAGLPQGPRQGGFAGMHPAFNDPLFTRQGQVGGNRVQNPAAGFNVQAPPGARWDPIGPGGNPNFPGPYNGNGGPPNPFGPYEGNFF